MNEVIKFDLGRNALKYLVHKCNIQEMHIPYYLCDVIRHTLVSINCKPIFYRIDDNFMPVKEFSIDAYILYPNYFGVFSKNVNILAEKYPYLIIDNAHSYFDEPKGFAAFNAGHKFGIKDSLLFFKGDKLELSKEQLQIKQIYYENFVKLHERYGNKNNLKLNLPDDYAPFVYPFLAKTIKEADELVYELKRQGKTIYRYWNPLPKSFNEYKFYSRLVPIGIK